MSFQGQKEQQQYPLADQLSKNTEFTPQQTQQRKKIPMQMCNEGRNYLKSNNYLQASKCFSKAIMGFQFLLKQQIIDKQQASHILKDSIIPSYSNLSLCYLHLKSYQSVITMATQNLTYQPQNVKVYYRRGVAYQKLKRFDQAINDFNKIKLLDNTEEKFANQLINTCKLEKLQEKEKQKKFAKKLIQSYQVDQNNLMNDQPQKKQIGCLRKCLECIKSAFRKLLFWKKK